MPRPPEEPLIDDDLVLYYYGETEDPESVRRRLAASPADRERYDELCSALRAVSELDVAEPGPGYEERVWRRLEPEVTRPRRGRLGEVLAAWLRPPRLALAAGFAAAVVVAFFAGRFTGPDVPVPGEHGGGDHGRQAMLAAAVADHLERSERLLTELANDRRAAASPPLRADASELLADNRLYRRGSASSGRGDLEALLDELERTLLEVANESPKGYDAALAARWGDLLFKVRVTLMRLRDRPSAGAPATTVNDHHA